MIVGYCPAGCGKLFETTQGLNGHLTMAKSCSWYRKGKIRALDFADEDHSSEEDLRDEDDEGREDFNTPDVNLRERQEYSAEDDDGFGDGGNPPNIDLDVYDESVPLDFHFMPY